MLSDTHLFKLLKRFCDDPFYCKRLLSDDNYQTSRQSSCAYCNVEAVQEFLRKASPTFHHFDTRSYTPFTSIIDFSAFDVGRERRQAYYQTPLLQTVNQAAHEILTIGRERRREYIAHEISNGLFEMQGQGERVILEYCIKQYTKSSFLYRACHRHLGDYYSIDNEKLSHYIELLNQYVNRYGKTYTGTVYRGATWNDGKLKLHLTSDINTIWYSPTYLSTSKSRQVAELYGNVLIIIDIRELSGTKGKGIDISGISAIPDEEEVLLTPRYELIQLRQSEYDPILKKHLIYLTSASPSVSPSIQNNQYDYRNIKRKLMINPVSSISLNHFEETNSPSENESPFLFIPRLSHPRS
jgi:hypothetical protein